MIHVPGIPLKPNLVSFLTWIKPCPNHCHKWTILVRLLVFWVTFQQVVQARKGTCSDIMQVHQNDVEQAVHVLALPMRLPLWWTGNVLACQARGPGFDSACQRSQPLLQWHPKWDHQRAVMSVHVWNSGRKRAAPFVQVLYWEQGSWKRLLDESDSCLSKGMGERNCESPHGVDVQCCTATASWWEPWWCWLCPVFEDEHWFGRGECSRVTLSRQCVYWPCQRDYLFGELVTYSPAKRQVLGLTQPARAVSYCYTGSSCFPCCIGENAAGGEKRLVMSPTPNALQISVQSMRHIKSQ